MRGLGHTVRDMTPVKPIDFLSLLKGIPKGAWVVISSGYDRVVSYGFDMDGVLEDARRKGEKYPRVMRVPESSTALVL